MLNYLPGQWVLLSLLALLAMPPMIHAQQGQPESLTLNRIPRVYGLAVAAGNPLKLYLATPYGLYLADTRGQAAALPGLQGHVMGFSVHPSNPRIMLAGGHQGKNESMGLMRSSNGGRNWKQISRDAAGKEGFHILHISRADPKTVYGVTNVIRVSKDGGRTWKDAGVLPRDLIYLAPSAQAVDRLYAATHQGLKISNDRGKTWKAVALPRGPASMVQVMDKGQVYVFVVRAGLFTARESTLAWKLVSRGFMDRALLRMAFDPTLPDRVFAVTASGAVMTSNDRGKKWLAFEGSHNAKPAVIRKGEKLFNTHCAACHGEQGRGQHTVAGFDPKNPPKFQAPALDNSAHAWHHADQDLAHTILNGSPQPGSPMIAWKKTLSKNDAESLVAYIKSLWNFRSLACQGVRHMSCMRRR